MPHLPFFWGDGVDLSSSFFFGMGAIPKKKGGKKGGSSFFYTDGPRSPFFLRLSFKKLRDPPFFPFFGGLRLQGTEKLPSLPGNWNSNFSQGLLEGTCAHGIRRGRPTHCACFTRLQVQKTREGCGCFWSLCGSSGGKFRENSGKIAGKFFPNSQMLQILGFRAPGKANPPGTLGPHCRDLVPTFPAGCFLKSTVPAFSSFSGKYTTGSFRPWMGKIANRQLLAVLLEGSGGGLGAQAPSFEDWFFLGVTPKGWFPLVAHRCCDPCRAHSVAANSRNFGDVAGVSRYSLPTITKNDTVATHLATPLAVGIAGKFPCKNGSRYTGV